MNSPKHRGVFTVHSGARPLRAWSAQQQRHVQDVLQRTLLEWQMAWALAPADTATPVELAEHAASDGDQVLWHLESSVGADLPVTLKGQIDPLSILGDQLFGLRASVPTSVGAGPAIARDVVHAAWTDWLQRLSAALATQVVAHPATDIDAEASIWTGALQARMAWCKQTTFCLLLPGAVLARLLPAASVPASPAAPLAHLEDALYGESLNLQVRLDNVTLTLGELEHLQTGDVVLLSHRLDAPLHLVDAHDQALCSAWLGQRNGRVAVELSALTAPALSNPHPARP